MACYQPLSAWMDCSKDAPRRVVSSRVSGRLYVPISLPCGKCIGCRMEHARQWAMRCVHEAECHEHNCMATLTYDDKHLPDDGSLRPDDVTLFLKRLRRKLEPLRFRYFLAGEYGGKMGRPHYHVLFFGLDFQRGDCYDKDDQRPPLQLVQHEWGLGHVRVDKLEYGSVAYVARYCLKKQEQEVDYCDKSTGVIRHREFTRMSRRRGIGHAWIEKNSVDTYSDDSIILSPKVKSRPPRFYDKHYTETSPEKMDKIKLRRLEEARKRAYNSTPERLAVRERIAKARNALLKRRLDNA